MTGRRLVWVLAPLLAAALVLEVGRAARLYKASRILAAVKGITLEANRQGALTQRLLERNLELLRQAEALSPVEVGLPITRAGQFMLLKRPHAAIRAYRQALVLEPRGEVYANLGRAYLEAGDREAAAEAFHRAILLDHTQRRQLQGLMPPGMEERNE